MPKAVILLQPGAADWEFGLLAPTLRSYLGFTITPATPNGANVVTIGGLTIDPETSYDTVDLAGADLVAAIGSDAWEGFHDAHLFSRLKARADSGRPTAAICGATLAFARAGILDDRPHTSNSLEFLSTQAGDLYKGVAGYRDIAHAISDGVVITAPGTAPASFTVACMKAVGAEAQMVEGFWEMTRAEYSGLVGGVDGVMAG